MEAVIGHSFRPQRKQERLDSIRNYELKARICTNNPEFARQNEKRILELTRYYEIAKMLALKFGHPLDTRQRGLDLPCEEVDEVLKEHL